MQELRRVSVPLTVASFFIFFIVLLATKSDPACFPLALIPILLAAILLGIKEGIASSLIATALVSLMITKEQGLPWPSRYIPHLVMGFLVYVLSGLFAGLWSTSERRRAEAERKRQRIAETLRGISAVLSSSLELKEVLDLILEQLGNLVDYDSAAIMLLLDGSFKVVAGRGFPDIEQTLQLSFPLAEDALGRHILETKRPMVLPDAQKDERYLRAGGTDYVHAWMGIPLIAKGEVIGLLTVDNRRPDVYSEETAQVAQAFANQAAIAIENARLFEEARARVRELSALIQVSEALNRALSLEETLDIVLREAIGLVGREEGSIVLLDPRTNTMYIAANYGLPPEVIEAFNNRPVYAHEGTFGIVLKAGEMLEITDASHDPRVLHGAGKVPKQLTNVPLRTEEGVIGVIALDALPPDDRARRLLLALGDLAAVAIQRAQLFEKERRRAAQLALINEVGEKAASILDLDKLMQEVTRAIREKFDYYNVALFLVDEERHEVVMQAVAGGFEQITPGEYRQSLDEGIIGFVARTGKSWLANDVSKDPYYIKGFLGEVLTKSELCVPIKLGDKVIGALDVQSIRLNDFDQEDLVAMEAVADRVAIAIENAKLYSEVKQRAEEMATLHRIGLITTSTLDLDEVLKLIHEQVSQLMKPDTFYIALYNEQREEINFEIYVEKGQDLGKFSRSLEEGGLTAWIIQSEQPLLVRNTAKEAFPTEPLVTGEVTPEMSYLGTPLMARGRVIGVISVQSFSPYAFDEGDQRFLAAIANQAAIAIENARLYRELQGRMEEASALYQVSRNLVSALDLDTLLKRILEAIRNSFGYSNGAILLLDESGAELYVKAASGYIEDAKGFRVKVGKEGITGWVAQHGEMLYVPDVSKDPRYIEPVKPEEPIRSEVALPLKVGTRLIGVLDVESTELDGFDERDFRVLSAIADQVSIAIENARLYEETKEHAGKLAALYETGKDITSTLELDELLRLIVERAIRLTEADKGLILLVDTEAQELIKVVGLGFAPGQIEGFIYQEVQDGISGWVLREGKPTISKDILTDPRNTGIALERAKKERERGKSIAVAPLTIKDEVIGTLTVVNNVGKPVFSQSDLDLVVMLASQAAIAIENARLYEEAQRQLAREERLNELARALSGELELDKIIPRLLPLAAELTGADASTVALFDPDRKVISYPYHYNLPETLAGVEVPAGSGLAGYTMKVRRPVLLDDYREHPAALQPWVEAGVRSLLGVPLVAGDEVVGALGLFSLGEVRPFGPEVVAVAEAAADLAAVAIQRARLFQAERKRRRDAEALRQAALALTSALDRNQVIERVLSQLQEVVPYDSSSVQLLQGDKLVIIGGRGFPNLEEILGISFPVDGDNPNREVMRTLSPFILEDAPAVYEAFTQEPFAAMGIRSWLGVPMLIGERPVGMITLDKCEPGFYTEEHARLAQAFAAQAAIAIENARLFEETRQRVTELGVLYDVATAATTSVHLDEILNRTMDTLMETLRPDDIAILLLEPETNELVIRAWTGFPGGPTLVRRPIGVGIPGWVVQTGEPALLADVRGDPRYHACDEETRSELCVPLQVGERIIGALNLESHRLAAFSEGDLRLLSILAGHLAAVIENAKLFEEARQRVAELEALQRTSLQLTSSLDLSAVLESIAESALTLVGATDCHIYLYDEASDTLTFGTALWEDGRRGAAVKAPRPDGLTATVAREGHPIVINDAAHHPLYTTPEARKWGLQAIAGFPLKRAGQVLGVFTIAFLKPHTFSEEELRVLGLLADQAAIAIENARLHEETLKRLAEIEELKSFNEGIVRGMEEGIIVEDAEGYITFVNPKMAEMLGYTEEELIGKHWSETVAPAYLKQVEEESRKRHKGVSSRYEAALLRKDGREVPGLISARPLFREGEFIGTLAVFTNLTEMKKMEQQLIQAGKLAAIGQLVAGVAHELNNPLTSVIGYSQLLLGAECSEEIKQDLERINRQARRAARIVGDLLTFARRREPRKEPININDIIEKSLELQTPQLELDHISIVKELNEALPLVMADPLQMQQVFMNIISNAHQALRDWEGRRELRVRSELAEEVIRLEFADTGPGIPPEVMERLFEPFFTTKEVGEGTGLGLSIAYGIVEAHKGRIWAESEVGKGATFIMEIPVVPPI